MSIISTVANYGGRVDTQQGTIKQFVETPSSIDWVVKTIGRFIKYVTPSFPKMNMLLSGDLIVLGHIYTNNTANKIITTQYLSDFYDTQTIDNLLTLNPLVVTDILNNNNIILDIKEVQTIYPEVVSYDSLNNTGLINYIELIPLIIEKMKLMQEEINTLKI